MSLASQMPALLALMQGSCRYLTSNVLFSLLNKILVIGRKYFHLSIRDAMIGVMLFSASPHSVGLTQEDRSCLCSAVDGRMNQILYD